jgi:hypothetical protein
VAARVVRPKRTPDLRRPTGPSTRKWSSSPLTRQTAPAAGRGSMTLGMAVRRLEEDAVSKRRVEVASRWLLLGIAGLFLLIVIPVVIHGSLLADEYLICMRPVHDGGYGPYLHAIWQDTGVVRPARFVELFLISKICTSAPYGIAIAVPLALKFVVAALLYGLLRDLRLPSPWPEAGASMWLLEPLGTEAALWPAALHVNLGLALALASLLLFRRDRVGWATVATLGASLSLEQAIFALPLAVWLVSPGDRRRRNVILCASVVAIVLLAYTIWPGENSRTAVPLAERVSSAVKDPSWYVIFPAVGLGLHSGLFGFLWAFPVSIPVVLAGAVGSALLVPMLLSAHRAPPRARPMARGGLLAVAMVLLVNIPLITTPDRGHSPRTFTPTWLVLAAAAALAGARVRWKRPRLLGLLAGTFAAFAVLSLILSVAARVQTTEVDQAAARWIAERTDDGDVVAVCGATRRVFEPAPAGDYHLAAINADSGEWVEYYTGRVVTIRRSGEEFGGPWCPNLRDADLIIRFPRLVRDVERLPTDSG